MSSAEQIPRTASTDLPPGTEVGGYLIGQKIGEGGMGQVYSATHPVIGKKVAVKVLAPHCSAVPDLVRRFIEEARAVNKIGHPNIVDIFTIGQLGDGRHFMVMEYLEGENLAQRIERETIPVTELRRLLREICEALQAAHQAGIVHRDLKPENIWILQRPNEPARIKLLDFGIAKLLGVETAGRITQTGAAIGTPQFMPPEQCMGKPVDSRADIYSLGIILYLLFTGTLPFHGSTFAEIVYRHTSEPPVPPSRHRPLPAALERLILDCLQKDPDQRPPTARAVAERLDSALAGPIETPTVVARVAASPPAPVYPPWPSPGYAAAATDPRPVEVTTPLPPRRSAGAALILLGVVALGTGLALIRNGEVRPEVLVAAADAAEARLRDAIAAQGRALEPRAADAARVRPLLSALELARGAEAPVADLKATMQDLFTDEEAWAGFRTSPLVTALVSQKGVLAALGPGFTDLAAAGVVRKARDSGMASGLVAGQDRAFVVAAAKVEAKGDEVVLVGLPLDPVGFQALSERTGDAVGLARSGRLLESAGAPAPRAALTTLVARPDRGIMVGDGLAGTLMSVDGTALSLLSVFAAPRPPALARVGIPCTVLGGLLVIAALVLLARRRHA